MTLWFLFALMTAAAVFAVLWPLGRSGPSRNDASEAVVYKDQLAEIDRDLSAGLIGASEAEAARFGLSAGALVFMTLVIEIFVYPESWPDHLMWSAAMLFVILRGPGAVSVDHFIRKRFL